MDTSHSRRTPRSLRLMLLRVQHNLAEHLALLDVLVRGAGRVRRDVSRDRVSL